MKIFLTAKDEEEIYRKVEKRYRAEDAERHVAELIENGDERHKPILSALDKTDFNCLATRFLSKYDCSIDENSQWEGLILDYVS